MIICPTVLASNLKKEGITRRGEECVNLKKFRGLKMAFVKFVLSCKKLLGMGMY